MSYDRMLRAGGSYRDDTPCGKKLKIPQELAKVRIWGGDIPRVSNGLGLGSNQAICHKTIDDPSHLDNFANERSSLSDPQ